MCIALLTTSHPKYALIAIDNRDEYILRPTSKPHWWTTLASSPSSSKQVKVEVLSSRDLQRAEHGTWLGITKGGNFAVLTNYRETNIHDAAHPVRGKRSRGGIVTAWLAADPEESTESFTRRMVESGDVKGVGGFSLICGKLRRAKGAQELEPLAILSNRHDHKDHVPWICGKRGHVYGLSNATYIRNEDDEPLWPKIQKGSDALARTVAEAVEKNFSEQELQDALFKILDTDDFPSNHGMDLEEGIPLLKHTIFVPAFGDPEHQREMQEARVSGKPELTEDGPAGEQLPGQPDTSVSGYQTGLYGTQRQTLVLVDWDGNVSYVERALYDNNGNTIPRGQGDAKFTFKVDGWDSESEREVESRL
ncbi:NRDE protein-domain-containing protein [Podospora aff. communis PSN243]|uniref:NRDE protein-domain-containing protein n=1 Tax=Podospora aff. communis PSN243 TaxID=3040156 RepID=A0AAV9GWD0_9PEZI|nr:NRDE protein-domain-containing protein [Podospora aff. communis PSN243]